MRPWWTHRRTQHELLFLKLCCVNQREVTPAGGVDEEELPAIDLPLSSHAADCSSPRLRLMLAKHSVDKGCFAGLMSAYHHQPHFYKKHEEERNRYNAGINLMNI